MNIRQCRGILNLANPASPTSCLFRKAYFLPRGCSCPRPTGAALAQPRRAIALSSETAWKARFARLWNAREKADVADRALAHERVEVALEAYRQVGLPGSPGPTAISRVASVHEGTASRILAGLRAAGEGVQ